jgi:hypothetical protein
LVKQLLRLVHGVFLVLGRRADMGEALLSISERQYNLRKNPKGREMSATGEPDTRRTGTVAEGGLRFPAGEGR